MMMMSSNTVGNNDFNNISGAVPPPSRKVTLPKDKSPQLASSKPDSFERANPRDNTPEAPPTAETLAKTGGSSVIAIGLSAVSLIGAGIAGWFAISKGEEAKVAKTAADAAKEEVGKLKTEISALGKNLTIEEVETKALELVNKALENHPDKTKIAEQIRDALKGKVSEEELVKLTEALTELRQYVNGVELNTEKQLREISEVTTRHDRQIKGSNSRQEELKEIQNQHTERLDILDPRVVGKSVDPTIWELFNPTLPITTKARESLDGYLSVPPTVSNIELIKTAFEEAENLHQLLKILPDRVHNELQADNYHNQINTLRNATSSILGFYKDGKLDSLTNKLNNTHFMIDFDREAIIAKAQAVVKAAHAENLEGVKTAQTQLVAELQQQFGRSHTEKFKVDYPDAILSFDRPAEGFAHPWVEGHMKDEIQTIRDPQQRLDALSKMFLDEKGGLSGKDPENLNIHKDTNLLANVVLRNLEDALVDAYPKHVQKTRNRLSVKDDIKMSGDELNALDNLTRTLNKFQKAFQPIDRERHYGSDLLAVKSEDEIKLLDPQDKFGYDMVQARVGGKQDEISNITEEMNTLLRTQLKALNEAKSVVIADTTPAISEGADKLVDKVFSSTHLQLPEFTSTYAISTSADALVAKMGENPGASSNKNSLIIVPLNKYFETAFPVPTESGAEKTLKEQQRDKAFHTLTSLLNAKKQKDKETDLTQLLPFFNFKKDHTIATITAFNQALDDLISPEEKLTHEVLMEKMEPVLKAIVTGVENSQPIEF